MASLFLLLGLAVIATGTSTTDRNMMSTSDMEPESSGSGHVTGCSNTKISATEAKGDYAWVLKGAGAVARQINRPDGFLQSNFTFSKTVEQLGNLPGSWSLRLMASNKHHKIFVCVNNVDMSGKVDIIDAGVGIVSGNSSMLLQPVRPHCHPRPHHPPPPPHHPPPPPHHNGPHDHPHPPPPHHETRDHPHPPPPHHEPHDHPHPPHLPEDKMLFPHPHEGPEDYEDFSDLGCQRIWKLCPRQLSERILSSTDSNDDIALVFGIKTATYTIEDQTGAGGDCDMIPSFSNIEKLHRPQIDQTMGEPDGAVLTAVVMETEYPESSGVRTTSVPDMK